MRDRIKFIATQKRCSELYLIVWNTELRVIQGSRGPPQFPGYSRIDRGHLLKCPSRTRRSGFSVRNFSHANNQRSHSSSRAGCWPLRRAVPTRLQCKSLFFAAWKHKIHIRNHFSPGIFFGKPARCSTVSREGTDYGKSKHAMGSIIKCCNEERR